MRDPAVFRRAARLGLNLGLLEDAIVKVTGASRVYILRFSEAQAALHFHLFPRTETLAAEYTRALRRPIGQIIGPELFEWARQTYATSPRSMSPPTCDAAEAIHKLLCKKGLGLKVEEHSGPPDSTND